MNLVKVLFVFCSLTLVPRFTGHTQEIIGNIKIRNGTEYLLKNVTIFSVSYGEIYPGDSTDYQTIKYNYVKHDPLLYTTVGQSNLSLYLTIPKAKQIYSLILDSVDLRKSRLYVRWKKEN